MIAFTQFTAPATCSEIFEHLHNVTLVAGINGIGWSSTGEIVIRFLIILVLPAAVGIFFLRMAISLWKKDRRDRK